MGLYLKYHKSIPFQVSPLFLSFILSTDPILACQSSTKNHDAFQFNASESWSKPLDPAVLKGSINIASSKGVHRVKVKAVLGEFELKWPAIARSATVISFS